MPFDSPNQHLIRETACRFSTEDSFTRTPCGVYFGDRGQSAPDPYFGGEGPTRTGCTRCGACMVGCRVRAKNTLLKNSCGSPRSAERRCSPNTRSSTSSRSTLPTGATAIV